MPARKGDACREFGHDALTRRRCVLLNVILNIRQQTPKLVAMGSGIFGR
jgi:hypothetical protein